MIRKRITSFKSLRPGRAGFGLAGLIVIIAVVAAVVFTGVVVYGRNQDKDSVTESTLPAKDAEDEGPIPVTPPATTQTDYEYLKIPELRIKIKLTKELQGLVAEPVPGKNAIRMSMQPFIDETVDLQTVSSSSSENGCRSLVSIGIYEPDQRQRLENDPIMAYTFDAQGKPTDGEEQRIVQLADKRYAVFRAAHATCLKGEQAIAAARDSEQKAQSILLREVPDNIFSL